MLYFRIRVKRIIIKRGHGPAGCVSPDRQRKLLWRALPQVAIEPAAALIRQTFWAGGAVMDRWVELAVSWLPFLLLIGLWFWFSRRSGMQARGKSGVTLIELYEQQVAETRRMNGFLERIAQSMEKHEPRGS
jgi:hypothetical protein